MNIFGFEIKRGKKEAQFGLQKISGNGLPESQERAYNENINRYFKNSTSAICISTWQLTLGEAPLKIRQGDTLTDLHPLAKLFNKPNEYFSQAELLQVVALYCAIGGNAYIHKVKNGLGQTVEMHVYNDAQVQPIISATRHIQSYLYNYNNVKAEIPASDIIHIKSHLLNPRTPYKGSSPLSLCGDAADIDAMLNNAVYSVLQNGGVPTTWLKYTGQFDISQERLDAVKQQFKNIQKANQIGKHEIGVIPASFDKITESPVFKDYDLPNLWTRNDTTICAAFRVPTVVAAVFGGIQSSTYNNVKEGYKQFTELLRIPLWNLWEETITRSFQNEYAGVECEFDLSQVQALQPDKDKLQEQVSKQWELGLLTKNEARTALGYEAIEGGDGFNTPTATTIPTTLPTQPKGFKDASGTTTTMELPFGYTEEKAASDWQKYDDLNTEATDAISAKLSDVIHELGKDVIKQSKGKIDWQAWEKKFLKATEKEREALILKVIGQAWKDADALEDLGDAETNIFVEATKESADKIKESIGTIREEVQELLRANAGRTGAELATILKDKFETLAVSRANLIARTTATAATGGTQKKTWNEYNKRQTDTKKKIVRVWLTQRDKKVRHPEMDMQPEDDNGFFTVNGNKTEYPSGSGLDASDACNCRCVTVPIKRAKL